VALFISFALLGKVWCANFEDSDTKCPCILKEECPRVYGASEMDVQALGRIEPCTDPGMVRCCGVTVSKKNLFFRKRDLY
jgi:hypothetical protein